MNPGMVSVVIPAFKREYILETIESVFKQTYKNIEIIVVDDGSPNNLEELLQPLIERSSIRYIYQENRKMGAAKNTGIRNAAGEFVAFIDDDDLWTPDKLEKQIHLFSNQSVAMVYSWAVELVNETIRSRAEYKNIAARGKIFDRIFLDNFIPNSSVVVRKNCVDELCGFNESKEFYGIDDYELWLRIASKYSIDVVPEPLLKIRVHEKQISGNHVFMGMQELSIKEKLVEAFGVSRKLKCKAYSHLLFRMGYYEGECGNRVSALKYLLKSALYECRLVHLKEIAKQFLPRKLRSTLQQRNSDSVVVTRYSLPK